MSTSPISRSVMVSMRLPLLQTAIAYSVEVRLALLAVTSRSRTMATRRPAESVGLVHLLEQCKAGSLGPMVVTALRPEQHRRLLVEVMVALVAQAVRVQAALQVQHQLRR